MKIFTIIRDTEIWEFGRAFKTTSRDSSFSYWAIKCGEDGRGRNEGIVVVDNSFIPENQTDDFFDISNGDLSKTRAGKHKLIKEIALSDEKCIVVIKTGMGYRGGNFHSGDAILNEKGLIDNILPFPLEILAQGTIAQGAAGRMGSGSQYICVAPKNVIWRTSKSGRLYGVEGIFYYKFDGEKIICLSETERENIDF